MECAFISPVRTECCPDPGICIFCLADSCASYVHPAFNPVAPYRYMLPNLYLDVADIANPDLSARSSA